MDECEDCHGCTGDVADDYNTSKRKGFMLCWIMVDLIIRIRE